MVTGAAQGLGNEFCRAFIQSYGCLAFHTLNRNWWQLVAYNLTLPGDAHHWPFSTWKNKRLGMLRMHWLLNHAVSSTTNFFRAIYWTMMLSQQRHETWRLQYHWIRMWRIFRGVSQKGLPTDYGHFRTDRLRCGLSWYGRFSDPTSFKFKLFYTRYCRELSCLRVRQPSDRHWLSPSDPSDPISFSYPFDRIKRLYDINVHGTFFTAREAARNMIPQGGGSIILVASMSANVRLCSFGLFTHCTIFNAIFLGRQYSSGSWLPANASEMTSFDPPSDIAANAV